MMLVVKNSLLLQAVITSVVELDKIDDLSMNKMLGARGFEWSLSALFKRDGIISLVK